MRFLSLSSAIALPYSLLLLGVLAIPSVADELSAGDTFPAEKIKSTSLVVWYGKNETMTARQFAAYCAPILWFSPDEPLLREHTGKDIMIPEPFPFEDDPGRPVVYFRLRRVLERSDEEGAGYEYTGGDKGEAVIHLQRIIGVDLDFFFYYTEEEGLNAHQHDVESVEMKIAVVRGDTEETSYAMAVTRTKGKAHGVLWYDNTLDSDKYTQFPMHILVEEAKHASCPD
ncbi:MAG: hypothetical protein IH969_07360, partial [Candidatus Krumholzibacteriota bacterium]|nr:hypothetical protein [Candidatus Krumholzibacteriota bacterium]